MAEARKLIAERAPISKSMAKCMATRLCRKRCASRRSRARRCIGEANLLIMPNVEAANITYNLLKMVSGEGVTVGPFLLGADKPVHILTPAATVRRIINMTAVASANARVAK